jgi:hypothetical protein
VSPKRDHEDDGEEIEISERLDTGFVVMGVIGLVLALAIPVFALTASATGLQRNQILIIGGILLVLSLGSLVWSFFAIFRRKRLVITEDALLQTNSSGQVIGQILYSNMIKVKQDFHEPPDDGEAVPMIGIALLSPKRTKKNFWPNFKRGQYYDITLFNRYSMPLKKIYSLIRERAQEANPNLE